MKIHGQAGFNPTRRLLIAIAANTLFLVFEVAFGIIAESMALLSDAAHNFSDSFALVLSLVAVRVMGRPATERRTFGYHRMGILVAFTNSMVIALICFFLFYGAILRFIEPVEVRGGMVMLVAGSAFLVNGSVALLLRRGRSDLNLRSAFHILRESVHILMESVPRGVSYGDIIAAISAMPGVLGVHDMHIWEIGSHICCLSAHVVVEDKNVS